MTQQKYSHYSHILKGQRLPALILDYDLLKKNVEDIIKRADGKKIRLASKSIRSVPILKRLLSDYPEFQGILCFSIEEAVFLAEKGLDDLLVAYPSVQAKVIEPVCNLTKEGKFITLMVDSLEQVQTIQAVAAKKNAVINICFDIDMSMHLPGLNFGVYRSSLRSLKNVLDLFDKIKDFENVKVVGIMGYEAQIAGLGDKIPGNPVKAWIVRLLKKISIPKLRKLRKEVVDSLTERGVSLTIKNGGGTGSLRSTSEDSSVNEIAMGSGLFSPTQFDHYKDFKFNPAMFFALEISRNSEGQVFTANGGGYIASGPVGKEKLPTPYLPEGMSLTANEGAGEVQTPIKISGSDIKLGDPVFFRHSKAGEVCERFNEITLISGNQIVEKVPTYRGEGQCFF
ncbi:MAG: amino acid deaminase/aldolase [Epsilonproteobacteria bacterium]|nr:MAG: amino acid deaminase/aldolase [Campylobacterota bacterium]RLA67787.1 MAG: amino acid deaminase/aldolase [Campylobacterota bacterium]